MSTKDIIKRARGFSKPFRVTEGNGFRLKDFDPTETLDLDSEDKPRAKEALASGVEALVELQDKLYAQDRWAVLLIFQVHGCCRQGRHDQACDVGCKSDGLSDRFLQSPICRRSRSRFSVALYEDRTETRAHRDLQS